MKTRNLGVSKRWGERIIVLPTGTWYWSKELQDVSFVPTGKHNRILFRILGIQDNNRRGATWQALSAHRDWVLLGIEEAEEGIDP